MSPSDPRSILVVDDTPANLAVLTDLLEGEGFDVVIARDGASALQRLEGVAPALILLDVVMPGIDGFETCRRIKAQPKFAQIPVFFITAQTEAFDKLEGFAVGAVDYIAKPFCSEEVLARVRAHLRIRELQADLAEQLRLRELAERQLAQSLDRAVAVVSPNGSLQFCTTLARALFDRWFAARAEGRAPGELAAWIAARCGGTMEASPEFRIRKSDGELVVRLLVDRTAPENAVLLFDERAVASHESLRGLGLTAREAEVLFWLSEGKSYKEIGVIVACEWRTVQKHAEKIYQKLHVENRHGATDVARRALGR